MTLLAWSLVEFSGGYAAAATTSSSSTGGSSSSSALNSATSQLRWGADYLMRAHTTPSSFVVQVIREMSLVGQEGGRYGRCKRALHRRSMGIVCMSELHARMYACRLPCLIQRCSLVTVH